MGKPKIFKKPGVDLGVATRRNELMLGSYRLSIWAQRFFLLLISKVKDTDADDCVYRLSVSELAQVIEVDQNVYRQVFDIIQELAGTWVTVESLDDPKRPVRVGLVVNRMDTKGMRIEDDRTYLGGAVAVGIHKELLPYVKRARARFTSVELQYAFRLQSTYSQRMYDILKTQEFHGHTVEWEIEELRQMLAMQGNELQRYPDFRRFVIERSLKDINERTDIKVRYKPRKTGARVTHLAFRIEGKGSMRDAVPFMAAGREDELYKRLVKVGLTRADAVDIVQQWGRRDPERITWHLEELSRKQKAGEITRSAVAWLKAGIKTDYRPQKTLGFDADHYEARLPRSNDGMLSVAELLKGRLSNKDQRDQR